MRKNRKLKILGAILAGGKSRRMGTDKSWVMLNGVPMLQIVVERVMGQVDTLVINSNADDDRYQRFGVHVCKDLHQNFLGPLAGILSAMDTAKDHDLIFTTAVDCPLLPLDTVDCLYEKMCTCTDKGQKIDIVRACSGNRHHPVIALWRAELRNALHHALLHQGIRKIDDFTKQYTCVNVHFDNEQYDVFVNINTEQDLAKLQKREQ